MLFYVEFLIVATGRVSERIYMVKCSKSDFMRMWFCGDTCNSNYNYFSSDC